MIDKQLLDKVEENSAEIDKTINEIIERYSGELDEYMQFVMGILKDDKQPPTDAELDDFIMRLSSLIYFTSVGAEQMGIRDDLSHSVYKEAYNTARTLQKTGTVVDKNTQAEIDSQTERVVNIIYNKSYKILKAKVESAQEVLSSCKKVLSRRMAEYNLSEIQMNK